MAYENGIVQGAGVSDMVCITLPRYVALPFDAELPAPPPSNSFYGFFGQEAVQ